MRSVVALALLAGCIHFDGGGQTPPPFPEGGPPLDNAPPLLIDAPAPIDAPVGCPLDFQPISGGQTAHRYKAIQLAQAFGDLASTCALQGSYLAIPNSATELQAVANLLVGDEIWVGVDDIVTETTFLDVLNNPYDPVAVVGLSITGNKPDDDCIATRGDALDANPCGIQTTGVCECDE